ncbi:MAG TPA: hypothetical protein VKY31_14955 [Terriglobia bacterium]|nr:hypothetical protein [Terriglobia bacterium]
MSKESPAEYPLGMAASCPRGWFMLAHEDELVQAGPIQRNLFGGTVNVSKVGDTILATLELPDTEPVRLPLVTAWGVYFCWYGGGAPDLPRPDQFWPDVNGRLKVVPGCTFDRIKVPSWVYLQDVVDTMHVSTVHQYGVKNAWGDIQGASVTGGYEVPVTSLPKVLENIAPWGVVHQASLGMGMVLIDIHFGGVGIYVLSGLAPVDADHSREWMVYQIRSLESRNVVVDGVMRAAVEVSYIAEQKRAIRDDIGWWTSLLRKPVEEYHDPGMIRRYRQWTRQFFAENRA